MPVVSARSWGHTLRRLTTRWSPPVTTALPAGKQTSAARAFGDRTTLCRRWPMFRMARRVTAVPSVIGPFARKGAARRQPRCQGSVGCFPALYGREGADRRAGYRCACRSMRPSFGGGCEFRGVLWIQSNQSHPGVEEAAVLARCDVIARPTAAREEPTLFTRASRSEPRRECLAGGFG